MSVGYVPATPPRWFCGVGVVRPTRLFSDVHIANLVELELYTRNVDHHYRTLFPHGVRFPTTQRETLDQQGANQASENAKKASFVAIAVGSMIIAIHLLYIMSTNGARP